MEQCLGLITKNTIELVKSVKSAINEVAISSIIPRKHKLAEKESKMSNMVMSNKHPVKKIRQLILCRKNLLMQRNIFEIMGNTSIF